MENNYDPNIPKWANANYPRTSLYDAQVNVMEKAYHFNQTIRTKESKGKKNLECKCYDYVDSVRFVQIFSKIYVLKKIRGCVIIKCLEIENEVKDEFVRYVGQ